MRRAPGATRSGSARLRAWSVRLRTSRGWGPAVRGAPPDGRGAGAPPSGARHPKPTVVGSGPMHYRGHRQGSAMARRLGAVEEMVDVVSRVKELLAGSQESLWAGLTPAEIVATLDSELRSLAERGRLHDKAKLKLLFAPTGDLQEISLANR